MNNGEVKNNVGNISYQCPSCGANMSYDPVKSALFCSYCETTVNIDEIKSTEEYDLSEGLKTDATWDSGKIIFHCEYCGADNIKDKNDLASKCPFCGSDSVIELDELPGIKPHRVIPFRISKNEAFKKFQKKLKSGFFIPKDLKKNFKETNINGIFLPSWTYDAGCFTVYDGVLGKHYTTTVGSGKNRRTVTKTRYFPISGQRNFIFDDVLVTSGKALREEQVRGIFPYNTNNSVVYDEAYLAGYNAEHYTVNLKEGWFAARKKTEAEMKSKIINSYSHDVVRYFNMTPTYSNIKYKYVLLPIWVSYYNYKGKSYYFLVNGETGKVGGKTPISGVKVAVLILIILSIATLILLLIYNGESTYY